MFDLLSILCFFYFSQAISASDTITPTQPLAYNETLVLADGRFALGFFTPSKSKNQFIVSSHQLNRTLTAWTSESDQSLSQYYVMLDIHGDPQQVLCSGSKKMYRAGPWNGLQYTGFNFSFINNKKEISYYFTTIPSVLLKLAECIAEIIMG